MYPSAFKNIANQPETRLQVENITTMLNRLFQPAVTGVRASKKVKGLPGHPAIDSRIRLPLPSKWSGRLGLAQAVNFYCVVPCPSAKPVSLASRIHVNDSASTS